jgi:competence protein ComEA
LITNNLKSVFTFSKKELNGLLVFCFLLVGITFAPSIYRWVYKPEVFSFDDFKKDIAAFKASERIQPAYSYYKLKEEVETKEAAPQYFEFNPNNLSPASWSQLGLSNKQIKVIKNYEAKGGRFYRKEDLQKIYSVSKEDYAKLAPYIVIPDRFPKENRSAVNFAKPFEKAVKTLVTVEINAADSAQLETVKGIGPAFASRIIKYRKRLGGFYQKEQLKEVYGIDSLKYAQLEKQISLDQSILDKININTATFEDLKRHPYLSYKQMNAIIQYRKQHGSYSTMNDLKKVLILNEEVLNKIKPYLTFND